MMYAVALLAAVTLDFVSGGSFFSAQTHQGTPVDPLVFIKDSRPVANAKPEAGKLNILHEASVGAAVLGSDSATPLYNADGTSLDVSLANWLGAHGVAQVTPAGPNADVVSATFYGLMPDADYSLFQGHTTTNFLDIAPLDGSGSSNSFRSDDDGRGSINVTTARPLGQFDTIVLVYHSDNQTHGSSPGNPGYTAHVQLVARVH